MDYVHLSICGCDQGARVVHRVLNSTLFIDTIKSIILLEIVVKTPVTTVVSVRGSPYHEESTSRIECIGLIGTMIVSLASSGFLSRSLHFVKVFLPLQLQVGEPPLRLLVSNGIARLAVVLALFLLPLPLYRGKNAVWHELEAVCPPSLPSLVSYLLFQLLLGVNSDPRHERNLRVEHTLDDSFTAIQSRNHSVKTRLKAVVLLKCKAVGP